MPVLAVIGTGVMGANHVRTAQSIREWTDVVVVDVSPERARSVGETHGFEWTTSLDEVLGKIDAAIVAVPSHLHEHTMVPLLERGVPTLLEKPVASDLEASRRVREMVRLSSSKVLVGHIERFNSAVAELLRWSDSALHVECRRVGPSGGRALGDVVADLMVHDLDIVRAMAKQRDGSANFTEVAAMWSNDSQEACTALLRSDGALTATVVASRAGQFKDRTVVVTGEDFQVTADLIRQSVSIHRLQRTEFVTSDGGRSFRQHGTTEIPFLDNGEPLQREHRHLLAVVTGDTEPLITVEEATETIALVDRVRSAAGSQVVLNP